MKLCILVGHGKGDSGGYDPGAVNGSYHEFKIAKEIAKAAAERLNRTYGADCGLLNDDGKYNLKERIAQFQDHTYDFIAEIHLNAGSQTASGTEVYYFPSDSTGQAYASGISGAVSAALGIPNRGAKASDYFGIIRQTVPTAVLVETCFISSGDLDKVRDAAGQIKAGNAIADGIAKTAGLQSNANGWVKASSAWYWYENGAPVKNKWILTGGWWYRLGPDGKMLTGYQKIGEETFWLNDKPAGENAAGIPLGACVITNDRGNILDL